LRYSPRKPLPARRLPAGVCRRTGHGNPLPSPWT